MAINAHTGSRYADALQDLRQAVLEMGGLSEEGLATALEALHEGDESLAERSRTIDVEINRLEREIGEQCIRLLALHQPVASDLRFVTMAMRLATDLERVGDLAKNVARRAGQLSRREHVVPVSTLPAMGRRVRQMMASALDAFVERDVDLAWDVLRRDDEVDGMHWALLAELERAMMQSPELVPAALRLLFIVKDLERVADHATNIAEGVIFLVHGRDVRHRRNEGSGPGGA
ncbi:MAG: phosphate transport system regulatory protein PhoU [Deltaproteobacteria bacterium]|nr:MAG: phosphate transport system regulatory protein PhoU [Deltaproteobacteria bacterium]